MNFKNAFKKSKCKKIFLKRIIRWRLQLLSNAEQDIPAASNLVVRRQLFRYKRGGRWYGFTLYGEYTVN